MMEDNKAKKTDEPWTDKERSLIVNHVLTHVLANAGFGNIFGELAEILVREGCPGRNPSAYRDQWRRKISKDLLAIYGTFPPTTPVKAPSNPKAGGSPSKAGGSPPKRKRKAGPGGEDLKEQ